jgi:hypothetical protein
MSQVHTSLTLYWPRYHTVWKPIWYLEKCHPSLKSRMPTDQCALLSILPNQLRAVWVKYISCIGQVHTSLTFYWPRYYTVWKHIWYLEKCHPSLKSKMPTDQCALLSILPNQLRAVWVKYISFISQVHTSLTLYWPRYHTVWKPIWYIEKCHPSLKSRMPTDQCALLSILPNQLRAVWVKYISCMSQVHKTNLELYESST